MNFDDIFNKILKFFRRNTLEVFKRKQPYTIKYEDIKIEIQKDVFPPDIGFATFNLLTILKSYKFKTGLDMGTGSGIIALYMKKLGAKQVIAIDNHPPAIICSQENFKNNPQYGDIEIIKSNLFDQLSTKDKFDLIVFNHPYSPAHNTIIFGNGRDGGKEICKRFLKSSKAFLNKKGKIIMSFSSIFKKENDPLTIAQQLGYTTKIIYTKKKGLINHYIYEFSLEESN